MHLKKHFTKKEHVDSALALVLICLIITVVFKIAVPTALIALFVLLAMAIPAIFYPFSFIWLNLSEVLGLVMSKVLLAVVFFVIVTPMGLIRKLKGKDRLALRQFKKSSASVFIERKHTFTSDDLKTMY